MHHYKLNPAVALFFCALLWSSGGILIKLTDWNVLAIAGIRSLLGALTIILVLRRLPRLAVRDANGNIDRRQTSDRIIAAVCYAATMILFTAATKLTTAANAILLQYTSVLYVIILGTVLLGEKNKWIDYVAAAGIFNGMVLLVSDGFSANALTMQNFLGIVLALVSGIGFGLTTIYMRRQKDGHPEDSFTLANLLTFIIAIPFIITGGMPNWGSVGALILLGTLQIGIPSVLFSLGITRLTAVSTILITMLEPVMNPVWVLIFYGEVPSVRSIAGGLVILIFLFFRVYVKSRKAR